MHLLDGTFFFFFLGDDHGFLKEGVKPYPVTQMSPLISIFFFRLIIDSLWSQQGRPNGFMDTPAYT